MTSERPCLVLIDGHALAYRAFHALPPDLSTPDGEPTNAVFGFASMLIEVLNTHKPDYLIVTFDAGRSFRNDMFADYKATREAMPDALSLQMAKIAGLVETFDIPVVELEGWEADDLLGTLAAQATTAGVDTLVVTGDTDAFQLVDGHTRVATSGRRFSDVVIYDEAKVVERYGIPPAALPAWKGLRGDSSDNIPGVPGVGDKTATKLLATYGDSEGVLAHIGDLTGKIAETLAAHVDTVRLGTDLATIRRDAPVELNLEAAAFRGYDHKRVADLFRSLEFRTLMDRLPDMPDLGVGEEGMSGDYRLVADLDGLDALVARLARSDGFAFDTETTSRDQMRAELVGISLSDAAGTGWYVPIGHEPAPGPDPNAPTQGVFDLGDTVAPTTEDLPPEPDNLPWTLVVARLGPLFASDVVKIAHNAKYDMVVLAEHGLDVADPIHDTMIAAWVAEPARRNFGLKELAWSKLSLPMTAIGDLIGTGSGQGSMAHVRVADAAPYACGDVDATMRLYGVLRDEVSRRGGDALFADVEMPMVRVLADMERTGIRVDTERLAVISGELAARMQELEGQVFAITGNPFNIGSTQQLGQVLFEQLKIPRGRRTQSGYSTAADALAGLGPEYPIVALVLEWRHLAKLKGTYVDTLPLLVNPRTGRVHTSFQQTAVVTGRISSTDPNLQNIPIRTEQGGQIRSAFAAPDGSVILSADYSQMELRVLAHLADDPVLKEVFATGGDIHSATASFLFDKGEDEVNAEDRRIAKMVNFGVLYGMSPFGLADRTGLSRAEATDFIDRYFERYAAVKVFFDKLLDRAATDGYIETILGRRRYFPELRSGAQIDRNAWMRARREAVNAPIQGSAADIMKVAMIDLHRALRAAGARSRIVLQVHDELLLEVPLDELAEAARLTRTHMEGAVKMRVGLDVDVYVGPNWLDLTPYTTITTPHFTTTEPAP